MSILGSAKYVITQQDRDGCEEKYVDSFDRLRQVIAVTYSRLPHRVVIENHTVKVLIIEIKENTESEVLDTTFTFSPFTTLALPDHL